MIEKAFRKNKFLEYQILSVEDQYLPGYGMDNELNIRVLGPVIERDNNNPRLRWFGNIEKTKNGHSIVLKVQYRNISMMLGGDLNIPSENLLLSYHTGLETPPKSSEEDQMLIEAARNTFEVDIAKSCHHGSSDFSKTYLSAINPIATVISSGDNEPHSHPRADTLGTIGMHSRGARPLIFSTELARSAKESIKHPNLLKDKLVKLSEQIDDAPTNTQKDLDKKERLKERYYKLLEKVERSIAVFCAINVRTDGNIFIVAQKIEKPRGKNRKWDIYQIEPHGGQLQYSSKH